MANPKEKQPDFIAADPDFIPASASHNTAQTNTQPAPVPSLMHRAGQLGNDLLQGVGEGVLNTTSGVSKLIHSIPYVGEKIVPQEGIRALDQIATPDNTTQAIGRGIEQAGEFMIPGPGEAEVAANGGKVARILYQAGKGAVQNKLQGGSATAGAVAGGAGEGLAQGAAAVAPKLADFALGIRRVDRMRGRLPGAAALEETTANAPAKIAEQAKDKVALLDKDLEAAADASTAPATVTPAIGELNDEAKIAAGQNDPELLKKINQTKNRLTIDLNGQAFPNPTTPRQVLDLKRGVGNLITSWNPAEHTKDVPRISKRVYGALDSELDRTVPQAQELNERMGPLITVGKRAEEKAASQDTLGRVVGRLAAHTGALTGAIAGYQQFGVPGAAAGLVLPELAVSPTLQMGLARGLRSPFLRKVIVPAAKGTALQSDRDEK